MNERNTNLDAALGDIDESKRATLRRLVVKGAFVAPVVASFAMSSMTVDQAAAQSNTTGSGHPPPSDRRLKTDIVRVGTHPDGFGLYRFRYIWGGEPKVGVMAQEVQSVRPAAVVRGEDGFLRVDYQALGIAMLPWATWERARTAQARAAA
jgi:endosialidase-like protein